MRFPLSLNLMMRVILLVTVGLLLMFGGFAFLGLQAVEESTNRALQERLLLAQITASRVDDLLQGKIEILKTITEETAIDPDRASSEAMEQAARLISQSIGDFARYVAIADRDGKVVWTEPPTIGLMGTNLTSNRYVANVLNSGQPVVSGYFAPENVNPTAAIIIPNKDHTKTVNGIVIVAVDLRHPIITHLLGPIGLGEKGYAEIIDEEGFPLASTSEELSWRNCRYGDRFANLIRDRGTTVGRCHDCHTTSATQHRQNGVMAFAALSMAPWGIVVQQDEGEAFGHSRDLQQKLLLFGGGALLITLLVAWLLTRSVVGPIRTLTAASQKIAAGNLAEPIPLVGGAEVSVLARSFEEMRDRLKKSLEEIQNLNRELEHRVEQRTQALEETEQSRRELLRKLVVVQEEERKFLARELHDETSQALTALVVGLDTITSGPIGSVEEIKAKLEPTKTLATEMLREVQRIILDLRPAILDDLGLVQAIDWFAETRFKPQGIHFSLETIGVEKRLPSELETVTFRIAQEAINNVARHAEAENASICLNFGEASLVLEVEDDGCGFVPEQAFSQRGSNTPFGLIGMRERVLLFGGNVLIESQPGQGTRLVATIPVNGKKSNGQDSHSVS